MTEKRFKLEGPLAAEVVEEDAADPQAAPPKLTFPDGPCPICDRFMCDHTLDERGDGVPVVEAPAPVKPKPPAVGWVGIKTVTQADLDALPADSVIVLTGFDPWTKLNTGTWYNKQQNRYEHSRAFAGGAYRIVRLGSGAESTDGFNHDGKEFDALLAKAREKP